MQLTVTMEDNYYAPKSGSGPFTDVFREKLLRNGHHHKVLSNKPLKTNATATEEDEQVVQEGSPSGSIKLGSSGSQNSKSRPRTEVQSPYISQTPQQQSLANQRRRLLLTSRNRPRSVPSSTPPILDERAYILASYLNGQVKDAQKGKKFYRPNVIPAQHKIPLNQKRMHPPNQMAWSNVHSNSSQERPPKLEPQPNSPHKLKPQLFTTRPKVKQRLTIISRSLLHARPTNQSDEPENLRTKQDTNNFAESRKDSFNSLRHQNQSCLRTQTPVACQEPHFNVSVTPKSDNATVSERLWPSITDVERLNIGGLQYKAELENCSGHKNKEGEKAHQKDEVISTKRSFGVIIVPSHTTDDCPICDMHYADEDFRESDVKECCNVNHDINLTDIEYSEFDQQEIPGPRKTVIYSVRKTIESPTKLEDTRCESKGAHPIFKVPANNKITDETVKLSYIRVK